MAITTAKHTPVGANKFISEQLLAERWGVAVTTLQKWRQTGYGPVFAKLSARVAYPVESVEEFERSRLRHSTSEQA